MWNEHVLELAGRVMGLLREGLGLGVGGQE